jgi:hypothetical protein
MAKAIAQFALIAGSFGVTLANCWFTFGLWPKSWLSFTICFFATVTIAMLHLAIAAED